VGVIVQLDTRIQTFSAFKEKEMLFKFKPLIGKKHYGDFIITVMLLRSGKTSKYIIKVNIQKFIGVISNAANESQNQK